MIPICSVYIQFQSLVILTFIYLVCYLFWVADAAFRVFLVFSLRMNSRKELQLVIRIYHCHLSSVWN